MPDPLRTEASRLSTGPEVDRDGKIEQLLLAGLDHYFIAEYDYAISVWTRVLFLDRSHARARAYIERARSALAERQRRSEELLENGVDAFRRGDGDQARRLVQAAIDSGAPTDEALAVLDRLNRLELPPLAATLPTAHAARRESAAPADPVPTAWRRPMLGLALVLAVGAAGLFAATASGALDWPASFPLQGAPLGVASGGPRASSLTLPRRGELALARARAFAAGGHLRDALTTLELVRSTDSQKPEADRLRGDIQRQLLALGSSPAPAGTAGQDAAGKAKADR